MLKEAIYKLFNLFNRELVPQMLYLGRERRMNVSGDFVRFSSLELIAEEIYSKQLEGSTAEVGVYRGDFASLINKAFPDRNLYLFDTFSGFNEKDISIEKKEEYSSGEQDFSKTSVELVLGKMKYQENCIIRKGFFPDTANGIDEDFVFVSLDADLYQPIYQGLNFFFPKLAKGGYIFIHDYNNYEYSGAKNAVHKFCREQDIGCFPLSDVCGSAVIIK